MNALVARPVSRKEVLASKAAQAALQKGWDRLESIRTWDLDGVREWADVAREARARKEKVHVGDVFQICVGK